MFGIGFFELVIIAIVALIFVGPKKLPDFMKSAGKFFVQMRRTANDVRSTFDQVVRDAEDEIRRDEARELHKSLLAATHGAPPKEEHVDDLHHPDGTLKVTPSGESPSSQPDLAIPDGSKAYQPNPPIAPPPTPASQPTTEAQWSDKTTPQAGR